VKFLEDGTRVDPDGEGTDYEEKEIKAWVRELSHKFMIHLSTKRTEGINFRDPEAFHKRWLRKCRKNICKVNKKKACEACDKDDNYLTKIDQKPKWVYPFGKSSNYVLQNPDLDDEPVRRGAYAFPFGYPLKVLGSSITGKTYPDPKLILNGRAQAYRYGMLLVALKLGISGRKGALVAAALSPDLLSLSTIGRPFMPRNARFWQDIYKWIPKETLTLSFIKETPAAAMYIWLPSSTGVWGRGDYARFASVINRSLINLIWEGFNYSPDNGIL